MNTLLNCDDVFEQLTSGPSGLEGETKGPLQRHLETCSECCELAEALRPARELLHEVLPASERGALPTYYAYEDRVESIMATVMRAARVQRPMQSRWPSAIWPVAVATAVCVMMLPWLSAMSGPPQPTADRAEMLAALRLPVSCFPPALKQQLLVTVGGSAADQTKLVGDDEAFVPSANGVAEDCCTQCHAVSSERQNKVTDITRLVAACDICH